MVSVLAENEVATYFPVHLGYACTVQKLQGSTLEHTRVELDEHYLIGGIVSSRHFVP